MSTWTAPVGQSFSQGMQYQHSSNFMKALPLERSMASTSSGQTSTQTVQPFSAMHLSSSMVTGTLVMLKAVGMGGPHGFQCWFQGTQAAVGSACTAWDVRSCAE